MSQCNNNDVIFLVLSIALLVQQNDAQTMVVQNRTVSRFYGINSNGPFDIVVNFGPSPALTIEADPVILPYIQTLVKSPLVLTIFFANNIPVTIEYQGPIKITITARALTTLTLTGSGSINIISKLESNNFQLEISGSGDITAPLQVNNANILLSGSGDFFTSGTVNQANINLSGSGSFHGQKLVAKQSNIGVYASGNAEIYCENDLSVQITGSGSVEYDGNPRINQQITGSGFITKKT